MIKFIIGFFTGVAFTAFLFYRLMVAIAETQQPHKATPSGETIEVRYVNLSSWRPPL